MGFDGKRWQVRLTELAQHHRVPGAALAVLADGEVTELATGVVNQETGVATTTDAVFQIGSISKVYTATIIMQLVDEGRLDLDEPVVQVLPELKLAAHEADLRAITVRHLLTHTSGIEGDHFVDTGRGDDCMAKYVASLAGVGLVHPVGATMSYSNAGFGIAGRIIEKITGLTWDAAISERITQPLGLTHTVTLPEEAVRFRVAFGHDTVGQRQSLVRHWYLPRSSGPSGGICASPADVIAFARLHLDGGVAADGTRVLSEGAAAAMRETQVRLPAGGDLERWGLGWMLFTWDGHQVFGHDGSTWGQRAFLRILPSAGVAIALVTNGGHGKAFYEDLYGELLLEVCRVAMPPPLEPPATPPAVEVAQHAGVYERLGVRIELAERDGTLAGRVSQSGILAAGTPDPEQELVVVPVDDDRFAGRTQRDRNWQSVVFYRLPDGSPHIHVGGRTAPKTA